MLNLEETILGLANIIIFLIGGSLFLTNTKSTRNLYFFLTTIFITIWMVINYLSNNTENRELTILYNKLIFFFTVPLGYTLFKFTFSFPTDKKLKPLIDYPLGIVTLLLTFMSLGNFYVKDVVLKEGYSEIIFGDFIILYLVYMLFSVISVVIILITRFIKGNKVAKDNIKFFFIGLMVFLFGSLTTNLLLPLILNEFAFSIFVPIFLIVFLLFVIRSIYTTKVFGTRFLLGRLLYFILIAAFAYGSFYIMNFIFIVLFGSVFAPQAFLTGIFMALGYVFLYNKFDTNIKTNITTRFINPGYDPYQVVDELNSKLGVSLELQEIADSTLNVLKRTTRSTLQILAVSQAENEKNETAEKVYKKFGITAQMTEGNIDELIKAINTFWEKSTIKPIFYDEIQYQETNPFNDFNNWLNPIKVLMEKNSFKVIYPIQLKEEVNGIIFLGAKDSDSPYNVQDQDLLFSIVNVVSIAISRSLFYEEIKAFSESLQKKVDEATKSLKEQNYALETAFDKLQRIRQQEQDMIDVMGHELRTPITLVRNALSVLEKDFKDDRQIDAERLGMYIEKSLESARREMVLIETLLAATKIDANRVQMKLEKIDIVDVINDSIDALQPLAEERKLQLKFNNPQNLKELFVFGDRVRAQEISDNFTSNALKYTMQGSVEIYLEEFKEGEQEMVRLNVKDTGIGITEEDIAKLGRKFFRAKQFIKESNIDPNIKVAGTGLGLYVSFELVKIMGGKVEIKSKVGEGSTFSFTIPKYVGQEPKHIDQTFSDEEDNEAKMRKKFAKEKAELLGEKIPEELETQETETPNPQGYTRLYNANDIISKINKGRQYLDKK